MEARVHRVEESLRLVDVLSVPAGIGGLVPAPRREALGGERDPIRCEACDDDIRKARRVKILGGMFVGQRFGSSAITIAVAMTCRFPWPAIRGRRPQRVGFESRSATRFVGWPCGVQHKRGSPRTPNSGLA
jgi:hypothetical protein